MKIKGIFPLFQIAIVLCVLLSDDRVLSNEMLQQHLQKPWLRYESHVLSAGYLHKDFSAD